jgi:thiamine biosynthesis lipoprotein ApbE
LKHLILLILAAIVLNGCGNDNEVTRRGSLSGVPYEIICRTEVIGSGTARSLAVKAIDVMEKRFEELQPDDGVIGKLNEDRSVVGLDAGIIAVLMQADSLRIATGGAYDYRQGAVHKLWKFDKRHPEQPAQAELSAEVAEALELKLTFEGSKATLEGKGELDLGHLAAGWAVDGGAKILKDGGVASGKVKLGSVVRCWGSGRAPNDPWKIEVPPIPGDSIWYVVRPPEGAVAVVHPSIEGFDFHDREITKVLDPQSGLPSDSSLALVSYSSSAAVAGGLAEALFVMGRHNAFEWLDLHQPGGAFFVFRDPIDSGVVAESDQRLTNCVSDSL